MDALFESYRPVLAFDDDEIEPAVLDDVVERVRTVPVATDDRDWEFVVIESSDLTGEVLAAVEAEPRPTDAPAVVCVRSRADGSAFDASLATASLAYAAWFDGVGSYVSGDVDPDAIPGAVPVEPDELVAVVALGYPEDSDSTLDLDAEWRWNPGAFRRDV